jgi:penicillin-binding protein 1C
LSAVAAWYIGDILRNAPPPTHAKPGEIAYKTGTSYGFRDAWAVGFDGRHTIAVWAGRADGAATPGLAGRIAAAPLLFDAFARLAPKRAPLPDAPSGTLRVANGELPPPLRRFRETTADATSGAYLEPPVQIAFPPDRTVLELDDQDGNTIVAKAEGGVLPLTWLVDGVPVASEPFKREVELPTDSRGFLKVVVIDAKGRADRVVVRLK